MRFCQSFHLACSELQGWGVCVCVYPLHDGVGGSPLREGKNMCTCSELQGWGACVCVCTLFTMEWVADPFN